MYRDHLVHFITLALTDRKRSKTFCLAWQKVLSDLCDFYASVAWCMKMSVLLMNQFVFQMRFDVFWAGLHCALWQLQYLVSRDKWEVAGSQILTNVLPSKLSHKPPKWLILSSFVSRKTCCHLEVPQSCKSPETYSVYFDLRPRNLWYIGVTN